MGFPILVRRHLYIESGPWIFYTKTAKDALSPYCFLSSVCQLSQPFPWQPIGFRAINTRGLYFISTLWQQYVCVRILLGILWNMHTVQALPWLVQGYFTGTRAIIRLPQYDCASTSVATMKDMGTQITLICQEQLEQLEQLERLHSEIPSAAPWLSIVIHIRSQVKTRQSQSYKI